MRRYRLTLFFFFFDKFIETHYLQYKGNNNTIPTILTKKKLTLHYIAIAYLQDLQNNMLK